MVLAGSLMPRESPYYRRAGQPHKTNSPGLAFVPLHFPRFLGSLAAAAFRFAARAANLRTSAFSAAARASAAPWRHPSRKTRPSQPSGFRSTRIKACRCFTSGQTPIKSGRCARIRGCLPAGSGRASANRSRPVRNAVTSCPSRRSLCRISSRFSSSCPWSRGR